MIGFKWLRIILECIIIAISIFYIRLVFPHLINPIHALRKTSKTGMNDVLRLCSERKESRTIIHILLLLARLEGALWTCLGLYMLVSRIWLHVEAWYGAVFLFSLVTLVCGVIHLQGLGIIPGPSRVSVNTFHLAPVSAKLAALDIFTCSICGVYFYLSYFH